MTKSFLEKLKTVSFSQLEKDLQALFKRHTQMDTNVEITHFNTSEDRSHAVMTIRLKNEVPWTGAKKE